MPGFQLFWFLSQLISSLQHTDPDCIQQAWLSLAGCQQKIVSCRHPRQNKHSKYLHGLTLDRFDFRCMCCRPKEAGWRCWASCSWPMRISGAKSGGITWLQKSKRYAFSVVVCFMEATAFCPDDMLCNCIALDSTVITLHVSTIDW